MMYKRRPSGMIRSSTVSRTSVRYINAKPLPNNNLPN